jgi:hypothetical protein
VPDSPEHDPHDRDDQPVIPISVRPESEIRLRTPVHA